MTLVTVFNYGRQASLDIYKTDNVKPGQYTTTACHSMNISQKYNASYKTIDTSIYRFTGRIFFSKVLVHLHCRLVIMFICVISIT